MASCVKNTTESEKCDMSYSCIHMYSFFLNACNCPFKTSEKQRFQLYLSYNRRPSGSVQTSRVIQHCNHINSHT